MTGSPYAAQAFSGTDSVATAVVERVLGLGLTQRRLIAAFAFALVVHATVFIVLTAVTPHGANGPMFIGYYSFRAAITAPLIILTGRLMTYYGHSIARCRIVMALLIMGIVVPFINVVIISRRIHEVERFFKRARFELGLLGVKARDLEKYKFNPWPLPTNDTGLFRPEEI